MDVLSRPRQGGKTFEAVQWVQAKPGRVLVVMNAEERARLMKQYGLGSRQVIGAWDLQKLEGRGLVRLGVDNIDMLGWRQLLKLGRYEHAIDLVTETRQW